MAGADDSATLERTDAASVGTARRPAGRFRRRSILVRRRYQLRAAALIVTVVLALLVFLNLALYSAGAARTDRLLAESPELSDYVHAQDRALVRLVVLGSAVFLVGVFLVSLLETHKTAGACINLARRIEDVERGRYDTELRLRRDDHLRELEPVFNRMCRELQRRTWRDVERLETMASELECAASPPDTSELAAALRGMAAEQRSRIE